RRAPGYAGDKRWVRSHCGDERTRLLRRVRAGACAGKRVVDAAAWRDLSDELPRSSTLADGVIGKRDDERVLGSATERRYAVSVRIEREIRLGSIDRTHQAHVGVAACGARLVRQVEHVET